MEELAFGTFMGLLIQLEWHHFPKYSPLSVLSNKGEGGSYESQNLENDDLNLTFSVITTLVRT